MAQYDFTTLSPTDFELLVRDLLEAEYGWTLEAFGHGRDGGVDLRGSIGANRVVVQCKHYHGSTFSQLKQALISEKSKIAVERPNRYLIATTKSLSKTQKDTLTVEMTPPLRDSLDLIHAIDLNKLISRHPLVERNHFKLWLASSEVLRTIVHSGIWSRSEALLEDIQSRVRLYVANPSYGRAAKQLAKTRVLVVAGPPGVGKSLLAEMLLLTHWRDGWQVVQVGANIEEAWTAWDKSVKQIFLYDDFLGQTNLTEGLAKNEDAQIVRFADMVADNSKKRFILTTRTQVLRQAEEQHEALKRGRFDIRSCIVDIGDYSKLARAQILYNHLYFSKLPRRVIREFAVQGWFLPVIQHPNYSPRLIEQVTRRPHRTAAELRSSLLAALEDPAELWGPTFEHSLSETSRHALLTLVTLPVRGAPLELVLDGSVSGIRSRAFAQSLKALEGTWIRVSLNGMSAELTFADPSCRDYVLHFLDRNPDEVLALLTRIRTIEQLQLIIRYAQSVIYQGQQAVQKYPGIRACIAGHPDAVRRLTERIVGPDISDSSSATALVNTIGEMIDARDILWPEFEPWLKETLNQLAQGAEQDLYQADSSSILSIVEHMLERGEEYQDPLGVFGPIYGQTVQSQDEFREFESAYSGRTGEFLGEEAYDNAVDGVVVSLQQELSELTSNYDNPETMTSVLDDIREFARSYGFKDRLASDFDTVEQQISDLNDFEPNPADLRPVKTEGAFSRSTVNAPAANRIDSETLRIRELFAHFA